MQLTNLIQLVNNLNQNMKLCLKIREKILPLTKIAVTADSCLLFTGSKAMTKKQLFKLLKKIHHRGVTVWIVTQGQRLPVYGVQVVAQKGQAILM